MGIKFSIFNFPRPRQAKRGGQFLINFQFSPASPSEAGRAIFKFQISPSGGFAVIELIIAIGFLGLLVLSIILAINPLERAKVEVDNKLKDRAEDLLAAISQFYIAEGRLPWADDLGSSSPLPGIPWTSAFSPEVGICGDKDCTTGGELITTNKLSPGAISESSSPLFIAKGKEPRDPVYACYLPQSEALRRATGKLYRISEGAQISASGVPEDCPVSITWAGDDVCWACVSK